MNPTPQSMDVQDPLQVVLHPAAAVIDATLAANPSARTNGAHLR